MTIYSRHLWQNDTITGPYGPVSAQRLIEMEGGIYAASVAYNAKADAYGAAGDGSTQDASAIQAAITACAADGGGVVWLPAGTYLVNTTLTVPSNVTLQGAGKGLSVLTASGSVSVVLRNAQTGGMVQRIRMSDFSIVGNSATASAIGLQLAGVELSAFRDIRISGFTGTSQIPLQLTTWNDAGTYRPSRENTFAGIETTGTNGIKLTKNGSDPSTSGCNNNTFIKPRCSAYTNIGIDIDAGEGNGIYGGVCSTATDATTGIRVNDDVNTLMNCNTDTTAGGGNTCTGVLVTAGQNDTIIIGRTGNGPTTAISDSGTNTIILRHPLTHIGGTVQFGSASTGIGFFGTTTHGLITVTGAKGGNVALTNLLAALANYGLIVDSTT